mgnify:CR=1 FL=1|tara:strand:- start:953 stop:1168 length:216 start_codon:yes stop_codon:yes gene_type:complete
MTYILKHTFITMLVVLSLSACSGPFSDYSNYDLKDIYEKCDFNKLTAAGAQRCNNIQKECDKRKKESGFRC